jgi:uncharacterized protein (DUF58 family)
MDQSIVERIEAIELAAKQVVEGTLAGRHRSPRHGFAVEFAQHREYSPGDDVKHLDWKVYGRTERYHLKQYEQETNLVAWLLVDTSGSMKYNSHNRSKYDTAAAITAGLAYMISKQTDTVGFAALTRKAEQFLKPSGTASHVKDIVRSLAKGVNDQPGQFCKTVDEIASRLGRRGIVFLISDFLDDVPDLLAALRHLRYQKHEVIVLHLLDPAELDFPFRQPTEFHGLENLGLLPTEPLAVREHYLAKLNEHLQAIEAACREHETDYLRIKTDSDLGVELATYLRSRQSRTK